MPISYSRDKLYYFENAPLSKAAPTHLKNSEFYVPTCQGSERLGGGSQQAAPPMQVSFAQAMGVRQSTTGRQQAQTKNASASAPQQQSSRGNRQKGAGDKEFESWSQDLKKWTPDAPVEKTRTEPFSLSTTAPPKEREPWELAELAKNSSAQGDAKPSGSRIVKHFEEASEIESQLKAQAAAGTVTGTFDAMAFERSIIAQQQQQQQAAVSGVHSEASILRQLNTSSQQPQPQTVPGTLEATAFERQIIAQHARQNPGVVDASSLERQLTQGSKARPATAGVQDIAAFERSLLSGAAAPRDAGPLDAASLEKQIFSQKPAQAQQARGASQPGLDAASLEQQLMKGKAGGSGGAPAASAAVFDAAALEQQLFMGTKTEQRTG